MLLRNLRIGTRLTFGFGVILLVMVVVALGAALMEKRSRQHLADVIKAAREKETIATDLKALALEQSSAIRNLGLLGDVKSMQAEEERIKGLEKNNDELRDRMLRLNLSGSEREALETLGVLDKEVDAPLKKAVGLAAIFSSEEAARVIRAELDPIMNRAVSELDTLITLQRAVSYGAMEEAMAQGDRLTLIAFVVEAAIVLVTILIAWMVTRSITVPLRDAVGVANRVAAGDLTAHVQSPGRDEAAELLKALRDMNDGLGRIVVQIRTGAESIAVGASQVAAGNQSLSSRTEEHASSLEETASTLEEFTTTVKRNAEQAKQGSQVAAAASTTALKGGEVVSCVVETMKEVTASSRRISDIIGVIDGISFQTNILALNAAVEAARAGEQGRGFAVVASEVRSLAQRSAASAKEIRALIEGSVSKIDTGARLVEQAGKTMEELVGSVKRVAQIMNEIAAASQEQSSGIEQINKAITQMDNVVQMNASLVEEATAAATSMAHQAEALAKSVAQFHVSEREAPAEAQRVLAAARAPAPEALERPRTTVAPVRREPVLAVAGTDEWKEF